MRGLFRHALLDDDSRFGDYRLGPRTASISPSSTR